MKISNYIGNIQLSSVFEKKTGQNKTSAPITELCKKFKQENNLVDIIKIFNKNKLLKKIAPSSYTMENYKFLIGTKENLLDYKKTLTILNKHDISICPKLEQTAYNKNKQYILLVLKQPENEALMKNYTEHSDEIDTITKCNFVNDLKILAKENKLYNPLITEDIDNIKVTSDGKLYVPDWNFTDKFRKEKEEALYFNQVRKMFNLVLI